MEKPWQSWLQWSTGSVFGVYVDTRPDSKTFGAVETVHITPGIQVFVPQGVCNGFQALEEGTEYLYFFDNEWATGECQEQH